MIEPKNSIFSDRRKGRERRKQNLPMPSGLDRRSERRRNRHFDAKPWWLRTNYAAELVIESSMNEQKEGNEGNPSVRQR